MKCAAKDCPEQAIYYCSNCGKGYCEKHRFYINSQDGGMVCRECRG